MDGYHSLLILGGRHIVLKLLLRLKQRECFSDLWNPTKNFSPSAYFYNAEFGLIFYTFWVSSFFKKILFLKKMKNKIFLLIACSLILIACSKRSESEQNSVQTQHSTTQTHQRPSQKQESSVSEEANNKENPVTGILPSNRKFIKEGSIHFETKNINNTKNYIEKQVAAHQGFVSKEFAEDFANRKEYQMEVRIPHDKFDHFVKTLDSVVLVLVNKDIRVYDVTKELVDLESRLSSMQKVQQRYEELLKQARTIDEIMRIQQKIDNLQIEIERIQSQLMQMKDQIQYSTLLIRLYEPQVQKTHFWKKAGENFLEGWRILVWVIQVIILLWPFWIIAGIVLLINHYSKKRKKSIHSTQNPTEKK